MLALVQIMAERVLAVRRGSTVRTALAVCTVLLVHTVAAVGALACAPLLHQSFAEREYVALELYAENLDTGQRKYDEPRSWALLPDCGQSHAHR